MVSVVILDNGEPKVIQLTFENLYSELKDIYGSELLIKDKWFDLEGIKNKYVCFVEADCLVSEGYFKTLLQDFVKKGSPRNEAVLSSATAINYWDNKIYGYNINADIITPNRKPKSSISFATQIAYIPGSIMRMSMLRSCLKNLDIEVSNLTSLSAELSMAFWRRSAESPGKGYKIYVNPKTTYLTTEDYVNDISRYTTLITDDVLSLFKRESV